MATNTVIETLPSPDHITLLLKHHKSTVLLSVLPHESFGTIKSQLLAVLAARGITTLPGTTINLPSTADGIELATLRDRRDASKGWVLLEAKEGEPATVRSGKGRASSKKAAGNESLEGAGLVDGSIVAYRVKADAFEEEDAMTDMVDDTRWDVVLPTYDDEPDGEEDIDPA